MKRRTLTPLDQIKRAAIVELNKELSQRILGMTLEQYERRRWAIEQATSAEAVRRELRA